MRTFSTTLTAVLTALALSLATSYAFAGNGNKGGHGGLSISFGNSGGGVRLSNGGGNNNHNNHNNNGSCHSNNHDCGSYNNYPGNNYPYGQQFGQAYEPFHSFYITQPGDSFYTVSLKEYGTSSVMNQIASFNRFAPNAALVPGQRLMLPSVSPNGTLTQSRAPAPFVDATSQGQFGPSTAKFTQPISAVTSNLVSNATVAASEPALPSVAVGSTLVLDGQTFGETQGVARLRVGGLSLPVGVLEWTNSSAKIRLPEVELTSPLKAEIEVLRADGSLASKTAIELTPAANRLALQN